MDKITFVELPTGQFIKIGDSYDRVYGLHTDKIEVKNGVVYESISNLEIKHVASQPMFDGEDVTEEWLKAEESKYRQVSEDYTTTWMYPGANDEFEVWNARRGSREVVTWEPYSAKLVTVLKVPITFDPRYESLLWHHDFYKANLVRFSQITFAKEKAVELLSDFGLDIPTHSGLRFMQVAGSYVGDENHSYEKDYVGTVEDVQKKKEEILTFLNRIKTKAMSKAIRAEDLALSDIIAQIDTAAKYAWEIVSKKETQSKLISVRGVLKGLSDKLYAIAKAKTGSP